MSRIAGLGMDLIDLDRVRQALQKNGEAFAPVSYTHLTLPTIA